MQKIIYRHGENDFSLWKVDLSSDLVSYIRHGKFLVANSIVHLLSQMPITEDMPEDTIFLFDSDDKPSLYMIQAGDDFVDTYAHEGWSIRSDLPDISEILLCN